MQYQPHPHQITNLLVNANCPTTDTLHAKFAHSLVMPNDITRDESRQLLDVLACAHARHEHVPPEVAAWIRAEFHTWCRKPSPKYP
jgi:hypothetical protein